MEQQIRDTLNEMGIEQKLIEEILSLKLPYEESIQMAVQALESSSSEESNQDYLKMVVVIRTDLKMTNGKIIA